MIMQNYIVLNCIYYFQMTNNLKKEMYGVNFSNVTENWFKEANLFIKVTNYNRQYLWQIATINLSNSHIYYYLSFARRLVLVSTLEIHNCTAAMLLVADHAVSIYNTHPTYLS